MRYIPCIQNLQPLLEVHARAKRLLPGPREHGASQLRLGVVPLPQRAEFDGGLDGEAVAVLGAVDGDLEDVLSGEADDAVLDGWVGRFDPRGDGVFGTRGGHIVVSGGWETRFDCVISCKESNCASIRVSQLPTAMSSLF